MQDKEKTTKTQISVEDLLRIKRSEKPDHAFWERFDQELHEKTWQALAKPEPLLVRSFKAFGTKLLPALPLSAAAIFVVALTLNYFPAYENSTAATPVYTAATPITAEASGSPIAGMAEDFAPQNGHDSTFVVGQFETQPVTGMGNDVTLVATSRPMSAAPQRNVHYVGSELGSGYASRGNASLLGIY